MLSARTFNKHEDDSDREVIHDNDSVSVMEMGTSENEPIGTTSSDIISEEIIYDDQVLFVDVPNNDQVLLVNAPNDVPITDVFVRPSLSRKRARNLSNWKQAKRKTMKNSGHSYMCSKEN